DAPALSSLPGAWPASQPALTPPVSLQFLATLSKQFLPLIWPRFSPALLRPVLAGLLRRPSAVSPPAWTPLHGPLFRHWTTATIRRFGTTRSSPATSPAELRRASPPAWIRSHVSSRPCRGPAVNCRAARSPAFPPVPANPVRRG